MTEKRNNSWDAIWQDAGRGFWTLVVIVFLLWLFL